MNILTFVLGLFFIFACCFSLSLRKEILSRQIESSYQSQQSAYNQLSRSYEQTRFTSFRNVKKNSSPRAPSKESKPQKKEKTLNPECTQLSLWPLLEGKEAHPALYETAAKLLHCLYAQSLFGDNKQTEDQLLNAIIQAAKAQQKASEALLLEKLSLPTKPLATLYYRMLRGTKKNLAKGYPSLLEYFSLEKGSKKICLQHASKQLLTALFDPKTAEALHREFHPAQEKVDLERIRQIYEEANYGFPPNEELFALTPKHGASRRQTIICESGDVCLEKHIFMPKAGKS